MISMCIPDGLVLFRTNPLVPFADGLLFRPTMTSALWAPVVLVPHTKTDEATCAYCGADTQQVPRLGSASMMRCLEHGGTEHSYLTLVHRVHHEDWDAMRILLNPRSKWIRTVAGPNGIFWDTSEVFNERYEAMKELAMRVPPLRMPSEFRPDITA